MGHVLLYSPGGNSPTSASSLNKPHWDDATIVQPPRALIHQLTETDKSRTPSPSKSRSHHHDYYHQQPQKEWDFTTTPHQKTKAQREHDKETEHMKITKTQQWYEDVKDQFPKREPKPKEPLDKEAQKPVLKGKLVPKETKVKKYAHDGVYELSTVEGGRAWSCCMNTDKDSRGCKCTVSDPSKRNFASIN